MLATLQPPPHVCRAGEVPPPLPSSACGGLSRLASLHPSRGERAASSSGERAVKPERKRGLHSSLRGVASLGAKQQCKISSCFAGGRRRTHCIHQRCSLPGGEQLMRLGLPGVLVALFFFFSLKSLMPFFLRCIFGVMLSRSM